MVQNPATVFRDEAGDSGDEAEDGSPDVEPTVRPAAISACVADSPRSLMRKPGPDQAVSFGDVLRFASGYWVRQPGKLTVILFLFVVAALAETCLPKALSAFLAAVRLDAGQSEVVWRLCIFLAAYLAQAVIISVSYMIYNSFETEVFKTLADDAFAHIYRLPEHFFASTFTGAIVSKINRARTKIEVFEDRCLQKLFPAAIVLIGTIAFMATEFPGLAALVTLYLCILGIVSVYLVLRVSGPSQGAYADAQDRCNAHLADAITGIATTKSFAREDYEVKRFLDLTLALRLENVRAYMLATAAASLQRLLLCGMVALLLGGGVWYLFHGRATVEDMAYLAFAYTIVQSYIRDFGENIKNLLTASYDLHAVIRIMREEPEAPREAEQPSLDIVRGGILVERIAFTYPGKTEPIFRDFSVSVRAGERVALVGRSGSGKTTLVRLLQLLYPLQQGRIVVDGQDIAKGSLHSLRSAISLVPQDPVLFHRTLAQNIAYGRTDATMAEIRKAARLAHIDEFIETLPEKYDTLVGERGIKLSGGERQRIAIARAILADRPILILDEATSSLDSASEKAIQAALRTLTHGRTSIIIAHRLSTALDADRILVFDKGRIVEEGTHHELVMKANGIYAGLFRLQAGGLVGEGYNSW